MSDCYGFDFNNDGKVSWEESHMTYHIERETARNNSLYDSLNKNSATKKTTGISTSSEKSVSVSEKTVENSADTKKSYTGLIVFIVIVVGILACIIGDNIIKRINDDNAYAHAIELIQNGDYSAARSQLWDLEGKGFGDVKALEKYCNALSEYERGSYISAKIDLESCIDAVRKHDEFGDPDELLNTIIPLADAEREENKRQAEKRERIAAENLKKNGVPYEPVSKAVVEPQLSVEIDSVAAIAEDIGSYAQNKFSSLKRRLEESLEYYDNAVIDILHFLGDENCRLNAAQLCKVAKKLQELERGHTAAKKELNRIKTVIEAVYDIGVKASEFDYHPYKPRAIQSLDEIM